MVAKKLKSVDSETAWCTVKHNTVLGMRKRLNNRIQNGPSPSWKRVFRNLLRSMNVEHGILVCSGLHALM
jgi:hypothetical protein